MKLRLDNQETFFEDIQVGDVFTYEEAYFPKDIKELASTRNIAVVYCPPGSPEYKEFGCHTMKVVNTGVSSTINDIDILFNTLSRTEQWKVMEQLGGYLNITNFE